MATGITLTAGMRSNLFQLQATDKLLQITQRRLATGLKVESALDDPVNFFKAQTHRQRAADLATRKDEMGEAVGLVNAGDNGIEAITSLIDAAKALAQSAITAATTTEQASLQTQFNIMLDQITNMATDSSYAGVNLLNGTGETLVVNFDTAGSKNITLTGFNAEANTGLSISDGANWAVATSTNVTTVITNLDSAKTTLRTQSKTLANNLSIITARQAFTDGIIQTLEDGAGNLVNSDTNEDGTNMLMLQTRQALGITSLSMASEAAQAVLRLF